MSHNPVDPTTVAGVAAAIVAIQAVRGDNESAHVMEDDLWKAVLCAIAERATKDDPADVARVALKTTEIDFKRWHA